MKYFQILILSGLSGWLGCERPPANSASAPATPSAEFRTGPSKSGLRGPELKQRQMAFLARIRESDPQGRTIDRAMLNEDNELGLILDRSVEISKVPALMRSILTQMAKEFPGQDLTVLAYTPSEPPRKIGIARLEARTREMTYTPTS